MEIIQKELLEIKKFIEHQNILRKEILTLEEASIYLGQSKSSIYKRTSAREIPFYTPGGKKLYFKKSELDTWIFSSRVQSISDQLEQVENYLCRTNKV
jgi:excisionase family DNA binding protein